MTDQQTPAQDTPALSKPPPMPVPKGMETLSPAKTPSIRPPGKTAAEIIARSAVDIVMGILAFLAAKSHIMSGDVFTIILVTLCGIRLSDIATLRKSSGNGDPPIAGGLTGGLLAMLGSIADVFRPHG